MRLKVRGDGDSVPNSVQLVHEGLTFKVQIWVETPARVVSDERTLAVPNNQRSKDLIGYRGDESLLGFTEVSGHVGSSYNPAILKQPAVPACEPLQLSTTPKKSKHVRKGGKMGPDLLAQFISSGPLIENPFTQLNDPITAELEAISISPSASRCIKIKGTELEENAMEKQADTEDNVDRETVEVSDSHLPLENYCFQELNSQRGEENNSLTTIEDVVPLNQRSPEEEDDSDFADLDPSEHHKISQGFRSKH
ncbi:hypothetical protein MTR67_008806 [Solanum verrucosum]|uniref:Uncharacterized protein n=1 Tax=Solanum verrucosum TaxID=315347 RepID=A0AAF0Q297_SOLVR|nr:hypothetical protein MTR67_008806 [Solanum verrucosum]